MTKNDLRIRNKRLTALGLPDYAAYIKCSRWQTTRKRWRAANGYPPCVCGEPAVLLHHKTYERLGAEDLDDLVAMCDDCHLTVHRLAAAGLMSLDPAEWIDPKRAKANRAQREPAERRAKEELAADWQPSPFGWDAKEEARIARRRAQRRARGFRFKAQRLARKAAKEAARREEAA